MYIVLTIHVKECTNIYPIEVVPVGLCKIFANRKISHGGVIA